MTHNNLLCILSFHSWNLIFQLLNFFLLGKRLDFEIRNQNFHTPRAAGIVHIAVISRPALSDMLPDANAAR